MKSIHILSTPFFRLFGHSDLILRSLLFIKLPIMHTTQFFQQPAIGVSARERQVLELLSNGQSTTEIATALYLSPHTVNDHRKALKWKLDAKNVAQMIRKGFELQLLNSSTL